MISFVMFSDNDGSVVNAVDGATLVSSVVSKVDWVEVLVSFGVTLGTKTHESPVNVWLVTIIRHKMMLEDVDRDLCS